MFFRLLNQMFSLRYAIRSILRNPPASALIICALALGIGVNTAIFSLIDRVLFRSLPVSEPDKLIRVFGTTVGGAGRFGISYPAYLSYRDKADSFSALAAYAIRPVHLAAADQLPERLTGAIVSGNYFETLGIRPSVGRLLVSADDDQPAANPCVVISERLWRTKFGSRSSIIGEDIRLNGYPFVVIGIAPEGFAGIDLQSKPEIWVPLSTVNIIEPAAGRELMAPSLMWLNVVGRLRGTSSSTQAASQLQAIAEASPAAGTEEDPRVDVYLVSLGHGASADDARVSWLLLSVVISVFLISIADVSGLLLARVEKRRHEFAVKLALGASRRHIFAQFLFEGVIFAFLGASLGAILASALLRFESSAFSASFLVGFGTPDPGLDWRVLLYTAFIAMFAAIFVTIPSAFRISKADPLSSLKRHRVNLRRSRLSLRSVFVIFQVAACTVLLLDAGLLLRTLDKDLSIDPGFSARTGFMAGADLVRQGYDKERSLAFFPQVLEKLRSAPGVRFAALGHSVPLEGSMSTRVMIGTGLVWTGFNMISSQYFDALGIPLLSGRDFDSHDSSDSMCVGIVNEKFAQSFWPGESALGKVISGVGPKDASVQIIGVVRDVKSQSFREPPAPMLYVPLEQFYSHLPFQVTMTVVVNTIEAPARALPAFLDRVNQVDANLPLFNIRTFRDASTKNVSREQTLTGLLIAFASLALLLAGIGIYALVAFVTELRTREFGIRLALGATSREIMRLVFVQSITLTSAGLLIGFIAFLFTLRLITASLYGVSPFDSLVFCLVALSCLGLSLSAALGPARRSIASETIFDVLRSE
jgi:predicted permease